MPDAGKPLPITVFISSPSDVAEERQAARSVAESLTGAEIDGQRVQVVALLWEDHVPAVVGPAPQMAVDFYMGRASQVDIYVGVFWTRLGSPAVVHDERVESGTKYEFDDADRSQKRTGRPKMLLYRCVRPPAADADQVKYEAVGRFFEDLRIESKSLPQEFSETSQFADKLKRDLQILIRQIMAERRAAHGRGDVLLESAQQFLANYEDLFGEGREHEHPFPMSFRELRDPGDPRGDVADMVSADPGSLLEKLFLDRGSRLFIVGQSGAGKTFAMLTLMQRLVDRARETSVANALTSNPRDQKHVYYPIYFNLSNWVLTWSRDKAHASSQALWDLFRPRGQAQAARTLDAWLIDELVRWYSVPRSAATSLVKNRRVILCLDGLDELMHGDGIEEVDRATALEAQTECVATINRTLQPDALGDHVKIVLCCREDTYEKLSLRPELGTPIQTQPLPLKEALDFLHRRPSLDGLRDAIEESETLRSRVASPLFLRLMATAYRDTGKDEILRAVEKPEQAWENNLLARYVHQSLPPVPDEKKPYTEAEIPAYLGWLARNTTTAFQVEDLQPSLLASVPGDKGRAYRGYRRWSVIWLSVLLALGACVPSGIAIGLEWSAFEGAAVGALHGLAVLALSGLVAFLFALPAFASTHWTRFGLFLGVAFALGRGVVILLSPEAGLGGTVGAAVWATVATIPCAAAIFGLFGYQNLGKIEQYKRRYPDRKGIQQFEVLPLEAYDWSFFDSHNVWRGGWLGVLIGPAVGVLFWILFGPARGLAFGLFVTGFVTTFSGISGTGIRVSFRPNEGIRRSLKNAVFMAGLFGAGCVTVFGISYGMEFGWLQGIVNGLLGVTSAIVAFLVFGGIPVIRHVLIGHALHRLGVLPSWMGWPPWGKTVTFLDDMVRYKLLRRVANGYAFRHDRLRQYYQRSADANQPEAPHERP